MKKIPSFLLLFLVTFSLVAQTDSLQAVEEIIAFQNELNAQYRDELESPLEISDRATFKGHPFYPVDLKYRVTAKLTVTEGTPFFGMKTSTSRLATERIYGYINFTLAGKDFRLPVYQSKDLMNTEEYGDYLFFPFSDSTNGETTYAGGRYLDLRIPREGDQVLVDFNKAYNPYCAYSARYSCPIVPAENQMSIPVYAGVKYDAKAYTKRSDDVFTQVDVYPTFPGGLAAMGAFLSRNMTYPKSARRHGVEGTVYVQFVVRPDGTISDVKVVRGISEDCDREAMRVVALMPKWEPGELDGKPVAVRYVLPLRFTLTSGRKKSQ